MEGKEEEKDGLINRWKEGGRMERRRKHGNKNE